MGKLKAWIPLLVVVVLVGLIFVISEIVDLVDLSFLIFLTILALVVLFGLFWLLPKIWSRAESFRGLILPFLFLLGFAWLIYPIIYLILYVIGVSSAPGLIALIVSLSVAFGLPWLLPAVWSKIEGWWWRFSLGGSWGAHRATNYALNDFKLSIRQRETDEGLQRPVAALLALNARLVEFRCLHRDLKRMKDEAEEQLFPTSINELNEGWRSGVPPRILKEYMEDIGKTSGSIKDVRKRMRGRCTVANVRCLLGYLKEANELAEENWRAAGDDFVLKWMALYACFNTALFSGKFKDVMRLMADHWRGEYYEEADQDKVEETERELSSMTVNPIWAIPRHLILAAAFHGSPLNRADASEPPQYWPWPKEVDESLEPNDRGDELKWAECWYEKATERCANGTISLDFSHAYAGFYFTLLYLGSRDNGMTGLQEELSAKVEGAFNEIRETTPPVSRYTKAGFQGIYKLVSEEDPGKPGGALELLREAAQHSAISGNRFASIDCLFVCCRAVAAQRAARGLDPEVDYCLEEAKKLAKQTNSGFYFRLWKAANYEVNRVRGIPADRPVDGPAAERILRIFKKENYNEGIQGVDPNKVLEIATKNLNEGLRSGVPLEILNEYVKTIDSSKSDHGIDGELKLYGRCAVANMKYLEGDLKQAYKRAEENWEDAREQETEDSYVLEWAASYAYFNTRALFLGEFEAAVEGMAERWNEHCAREDRREREEKIDERSEENLLTVDPVLALPRHLILAAAFKGSPLAAAFNGSLTDRRQYWPSGAYYKLGPSERESELKWAECWYEQAKEICPDGTISLDFSHAYAGFYFTLLYLDSRDAETSKRSYTLAKEAFEAVEIDEKSPIVSRYAYSGFYGIFKLVTEEDPEEALEYLREAAQYSGVSGNKFASVDCLFTCCHAVAAQRVEQKAEREQRVKRNLEPEVDYYLEEAEAVAKKIGYGFYYDLCEAARSEVSKMRGRTGQAERHDARTRVGQAGKRILLILRTDPAKASTRH